MWWKYCQSPNPVASGEMNAGPHVTIAATRLIASTRAGDGMAGTTARRAVALRRLNLHGHRDGRLDPPPHQRGAGDCQHETGVAALGVPDRWIGNSEL